MQKDSRFFSVKPSPSSLIENPEMCFSIRFSERKNCTLTFLALASNELPIASQTACCKVTLSFNRLTAVAMSIFAGYEGLSALNDAVSMFLKLICSADDTVFSNSLLSDRIEWKDPNLKVNMLIYVNELRKLRLEGDKLIEYKRKEKLLRKNLLKIFVDKITSVDELSSSDDSSIYKIEPI